MIAAESPLYLDHHATTPIDPRVLDAMIEVLRELPGNPSSAGHAPGRAARARVEAARAEVASATGVLPDEVIFTSGATEALHLAIRGLAGAAARPGAQVLAVLGDHPAVIDAVQATEVWGCKPRLLPRRPDGHLDPAVLATALMEGRDGTRGGQGEGTLALVITAVHNEFGVVADVTGLGAQIHAAGGLLIVDAAQAPGRIAIDAAAWDADLVALTAHKAYGPKGIGALLRRRVRSVPLQPLWGGGGQEGGMRAGTLPTAQIAGLGCAMALAAGELERDTAHLTALRDQLWQRLETEVPAITWNGDRERRVPGNLNLRIQAVDAAALMVDVPELAFSSGSACSSGAREPSRALLSLGLTRDQALCSVRIGLGRFTTAHDVARAAELLIAAIGRQRQNSALWALRHDPEARALLGLDAEGWPA